MKFLKLNKTEKFWNKFSTFPVFIILLILFSAFYFFYSRVRSQSNLYVLANLGSAGNDVAISSRIAYAINAGDADKSTFGRINAVVIDKEMYEGGGSGMYVLLLLKISAIKDRSGLYLYKNKPLFIYGNIDLKFSKVGIFPTILYFGVEPPNYEKKILKVIIKIRGEEPDTADLIKIGSEMKNNKGEVMAKIINKKVTPYEVRSDSASGQALISYDMTKRDIELTVDILTKKIGDLYVFREIQKVKHGETIDLFFPEVTLWDSRIITVQF